MDAQKFVVRLLSADDELLAWAEVYAAARVQDRGGSCPFFAVQPSSQFPVEKDGTVTKVTIHWCELDVARVQVVLQPHEVKVGQVMTFAWLEPVWIVPGMRDVPLPTTTTRGSVILVPPVGSLAAVTS